MAWLIDEGYDVIGFMADVGQEEVSCLFRLQRRRLTANVLFAGL